MNSKVGLIKVKTLVNSTTEQRKQQHYQLPSIGNQPLEIYEYMVTQWRTLSRATLPIPPVAC